MSMLRRVVSSGMIVAALAAAPAWTQEGTEALRAMSVGGPTTGSRTRDRAAAVADLWGRLDAGDRLLKLLGGGTGGAKELFQAIVAEEGTAGLVRPSILAERRTEIDRLP